MWEDIQQWGLRLAGVAGALVSMRFVSGTLSERIPMFIGGAFFSFYATEWTAQWLALPEGLTGFLLGLFGMSVLNRVWEWMQATTVVRDFLDAWFRKSTPPPLPPKKDDER
jgi:hypothetical protein